jgi:hypothetical protein
MVANLSRQDERRGTRRVLFWGSAFGIAVIAAILVWVLVVVPGQHPGNTTAQLLPTGTPVNQGFSESIAAKNHTVTPEQPATGGPSRNASGEAAQIDQSAGPLQLTDVQRNQIHAYFAGKNAGRVQNPHFALSVGAAVPQQVQLQKLPSTVSSVMQGFQNDQYVLVGTELVVVDPDARRVVAIVPNVG